jgi:DNA-binding HxlR family transcriptional regulator
MDNIAENQACDDGCPVRRTAQIIEGKWTTLVIRELLPGKKRYSEIQRALAGISPKVLAARLRHLEQHRLITRTVYPTIPPTTEYALTGLGRKLEPVLMAMAQFGAQFDRERSKAGSAKAQTKKGRSRAAVR